MLAQLTIEYQDGRIETKIVDALESTVYPQRDGIKHSHCKTFKYKVPKHNYLPISIVRFPNKTMIYPAQIECHPNTSIKDVIEIETEEQKANVQIEAPKTEEPKTWKFESASGGGTYIVKQTKTGKLICDCPGTWRAKDRRCKHIKEVENY
jgi:hypothetical protein